MRSKGSAITISGIPGSVTNSPKIMVLKVFEVLGILELAVDVRDVRNLAMKESSVTGRRQRPSIADGFSLSFIITLISLSICHYIISKKQEEKILTIRLVFALDQPGSVLVRQFVDFRYVRLVASH